MTALTNIGSAYYEFWLTTDSGVRLAQLTSLTTTEMSWELNKLGSFRLTMPRSFNLAYIRKDNMVQVWRQPAGGKLGLWRVFFIRRWRFANNNGQMIIELSGPDVKDLLRRRIVAAYSSSAQASKTDYADDMMKAVVTESKADGVAPLPASGTRVWSNLSVAADFGLGPSISKSFPFEKLLTLSGQGALASIAKTAKEEGTEVFFDIVPNVIGSDSITFEFVTYVNYVRDVSSLTTFDMEDGNLKDPSLEYDYTEEDNYFYAGGQGEDDKRIVHQAYDVTSYSSSIWGRSEGFADARNLVRAADVINAAKAALQEAKPIIRFNAQPIDTMGTRYGIDWDLGYKVGVKFLNLQFYTLVRSVVLTLDDSGNEDIRAKLNYESTV